MTNYLELIPKPAAATVNVGLTPPKPATLRAILGEPRADYTGACQPVTGPFKDRIVTRSVGPFRCTGIDLAVESLGQIMSAVERELPDLHAILGTVG
ncbi:MAG: M15 family peptidase, partial [Alphaproteobacteria bacterium]